MSKKVMSIDDLYDFCLKNKFNHFSTNESNFELCVQMPANGLFKKEDEDRHREGLRPFTAKAYHDHINLNHSEINEDVFKENTKSAPFRPILANIIKNEETGELDFGSHDFIIEEDENGDEKIVYKEQPVGVINGDFYFEYDEDQEVTRAVLNGYLYEEYCQDAIDILERRNGTDCSIELNIREMSFNTENKTLMLDDYYISGLTMLGSTVKPGMKGSNLTLKDFSSENNSLFSHAEINGKLIDTLEKINDVLQSFNIKNANGKEEVIVEKNKDFEEEVAEEASETEEAAAESTEDVTVTESEEVSEETVDETPEVTAEETVEEFAEENEDESSNEIKDFTKTFSISHEDIRCALYNLIAPFEEEDNAWYGINAVYDDYFVMQDFFNDKNLYGCKYSVDGDNVYLEGERYKLFAEYLTESEKIELDDMRANYSSIQEKLNKYEMEELNAEKESIFEDESYADYLEENEFKELIENKDKYSVEELKDKAEIAFAKCVKRTSTFAAKNSKKNIVRHELFAARNEEEKKPYGNLFG